MAVGYLLQLLQTLSQSDVFCAQGFDFDVHGVRRLSASDVFVSAREERIAVGGCMDGGYKRQFSDAVWFEKQKKEEGRKGRVGRRKKEGVSHRREQQKEPRPCPSTLNFTNIGSNIADTKNPAVPSTDGIIDGIKRPDTNQKAPQR